MIKFGNDIVTFGGDWLKYVEPEPPTPVVDDELLISSDTVTTVALRSGGFGWYENNSPITYSGNNRYVVHKIALSNAYGIIYHEHSTETIHQGQVEQIMMWNSDDNCRVGIANLVSIGQTVYSCGCRRSGLPMAYAYTNWTKACVEDIMVGSTNDLVIFRFIVDRDTNKVNVYCSSSTYGTTQRLIYDATMVDDIMLKSVSSIAPSSTTASNNDATRLYVDAKYEMHACSSFDVAIAC